VDRSVFCTFSCLDHPVTRDATCQKMVKLILYGFDECSPVKHTGTQKGADNAEKKSY
jgi:hypothetical protein